MITLNKFTGINNVVPDYRLKTTELALATNVDIGMSGEVKRRAGYESVSTDSHRWLHQGASAMLAVKNGDLVRTDGATQTVLLESLGPERVWYCNLPDGRTTFSTGLIHGITDGYTVTDWGIPIPPSIGALTDVPGQLFPGDYQYAITYVRLSDGLEGGPAYSNPIPVASGGVLLTGLPVETGYMINVYLSGVNAGQPMYAGSTLTDSFSFLQHNSKLVMPCRSEYLHPMPLGTVTAFWHGRTLVADGKVLWASEPHRPELCDMRRSYKQFESNITMVQPVADGVYVGTETELCFMGGSEFEGLTYVPKMAGRVVLGSGVTAEGEQIRMGDRTGQGEAMICIADGVIVAGFQGGMIQRLTEGIYRTTATQVVAAFRMNHGVPQYVAIPQ